MRQSEAQYIIELTSGQVLTMTIDGLIKHFNLVVNGYKFSARTSSRSPGLRLLFVGIALTLVNIWVSLK